MLPHLVPFSQLSDRAGFPAGVFNVVTCGRERVQEVGTALMEDERVTKLSFTGSTAIGKVRKEGNCEMCGEEREWRGNRSASFTEVC